MRLLQISLILLVATLTLSAAPNLGLSIGDRASFDITRLAFTPRGDAGALRLANGAAGSAELEAFLASRPRQPTGFELTIEVDTARCSKLEDAARRERPVERSIIRLADDASIHQWTVQNAEVGNVRCATGSAELEISGSRITYDGNVPK